MKPAPFDYHAPASVSEALELLARYGPRAAVLAGGQSLLPQLNGRERQPEQVVDIGRIDELEHFEVSDRGLELGAMVRQADVETHPMVRDRFSYLSDGLAFTASAPVKNRGTVLGSLSHADPNAELPAVSLCAGAEVVAISAARGERTLPLSEFFVGPFRNSLEPDELLWRARFPSLATDSGFAVAETYRRYNGVAIAGAAAWVSRRGDRVGSVRLVAFGLGDRPQLCSDVTGIEGLGLREDQALRDAAGACVESLQPAGDVLASSAYRSHAIRTLAGRAVVTAAARARGSA